MKLSRVFFSGSAKSLFPISYKSRNLRDPPNFTILYSYVFGNFILADELFSKALQSLKSCV